MKQADKEIYVFSGKVIRNEGRGTKIGFKTANVNVHKNAPEGVFAGHVNIGDNLHEALIFIGKPITFNDQNKRSEVYVLNFNGNLYGEKITVKLYKKLRDNKKFSSTNDLVAQIKEDMKEAQDFFAKNNV
jgi:riboflavin kinase/FMN adenylyltransferase